ncbi:D-alanyl-D-alanine carboxypeptidase-like protein [Kribbella amoyensis]|uniref:D-alanyl-D-alanine carboxypeptidase-like protein n=1 Tax=Kribbella amoyensis TaxID=996641 RepID=A0A561BRB5_9ACTN|nr:M15 family metallopeptidase [Kribbella amoyensis]TWD81425.1 D-alanyl-D-alanine carboxypeptidase-like protein [Kribbella amoyensis]
MTNDSPRRTFSVRAQVLSVTGVAVLLSALVWHAELADFAGIGSGADKQPVVSGSGPGGTTPPPVDASTPAGTPSRTPSRTPTRTPSRQPATPKPKKQATTPSYDESSTEGMSPKLRTRLLKAIGAARKDGVTITITSGRRSSAKQAKLFAEAVEKYGSFKAASRWVLPPEYSAHVQGKAVDIGPRAGMTWLDENGYRFGLCRRYDNEPWHFEALTTPGRACPPREPHAVAKHD